MAPLAKPETLREGDRVLVFLGADYKSLDVARARKLRDALTQHIDEIERDADLASNGNGTTHS